MIITHYFENLLQKKNLTTAEMQDLMQACLQGKLSDLQIAVFLSLMRMKGETVNELTTALMSMHTFTHFIDLGENLIDIVGTGGDGQHTFNISTASSIVAAAAGVRVAKHGNHSVSSKSGSADVLLQAGVKLELSEEKLRYCLNKTNLCFLFAPHFNLAMQNVRSARKALGFRTFFNLLGPLMNPARVKRQVVGVFDAFWQEPLAKVLVRTGSERVLVLNSYDKLDEVSIAAKTTVVEYQKKQWSTWTINPVDYGIVHSTLEGITVNSPQESLNFIKSVFAGESGPARDAVVLNAALGIYCADDQADFSESLNRAITAIDTGAAKTCFALLKECSMNDSLN